MRSFIETANDPTTDFPLENLPFGVFRREITLDAQETVFGSGASGINAIVVTSRRLLGFSSRTLAWSKTDRDLHEKVLERRILPTFSLVRTDKHLYGFRGANGIWFKEALGVREKYHRLHSNNYGSVIVTNEDSWDSALCSASFPQNRSAFTSASRKWAMKTV